MNPKPLTRRVSQTLDVPRWARQGQSETTANRSRPPAAAACQGKPETGPLTRGDGRSPSIVPQSVRLRRTLRVKGGPTRHPTQTAADPQSPRGGRRGHKRRSPPRRFVHSRSGPFAVCHSERSEESPRLRFLVAQRLIRDLRAMIGEGTDPSLLNFYRAVLQAISHGAPAADSRGRHLPEPPRWSQPCPACSGTATDEDIHKHAARLTQFADGSLAVTQRVELLCPHCGEHFGKTIVGPRMEATR